MLSSPTTNGTNLLKVNNSKGGIEKERQVLSSDTNQFSIIIPAYNEEKRIKPVLEDIVDYITQNNLDWEIILAIDGNDGTEELVTNFLPSYNNIRIVKASGRSGKGGSIKRSLKFVKSDFVILMDADNSIPFSTMVMNLHLIDEFDCIIFSRYAASMNEIPTVRRLISRGFNWLLRISLDLNIKDTQSGYKIMKTAPFKKAMNMVSITNAFFDVALIYHMIQENLNVTEVDVNYNHRDGSKFNPLGLVIGLGTSLLAFRIRYSRFYRYIPKDLIQLYYRKFRWI